MCEINKDLLKLVNAITEDCRGCSIQSVDGLNWFVAKDQILDRIS